MLMQNKKKISDADRVFSENTLKPLLSFLVRYTDEYRGITDYRQIRKDPQYPSGLGQEMIFSVPAVERDVFSKDEGIKLINIDHITGKSQYFGNIALRITLDLSEREPKVVGYCYKYWFDDFKYQPKSSDKGTYPDLTFHFRIDKDAQHSDEGLEHHISVVNSLPRFESNEITTQKFLDYIENRIFPIVTTCYVDLEKGNGFHIALKQRV